ncbi:helix-turn-helix domain-containing protein, partial [Bacteroides ovatus]|jgi:excisionase family DNA binding protein
MYQEMRTKDDAWMLSIHESIDQLSEILDSMPKDGAALQHDDEYLCDKEVAYMLKVSRRTLSEYRSNGTLPYYVLGGKVLYKRSEIEQALKREYNGKHLMNNSG